MGLDYWENYKPTPKQASKQRRRQLFSGLSLESRWILKFQPKSKRARRIRARLDRKMRKYKKDVLIAAGVPWWATLTRAEAKASRKSWELRNPEKLAAHLAVAEAVRTGRLVRPETCSGCGAGGRIEGHHPDYDEPLVVIWYCPACHRAEHEILGLLESHAPHL